MEARLADIQVAANWSESAGSNNSAVPDGLPEGMPYAGVNDAVREVMGAIKREWNRSHPTVASGGTSTALTLTYTVAPPAYVQGMIFTFIVTTSCGDNPTLNVSGLGARSLYWPTAAGAVGVIRNQLIAGNVVTVAYNGTQFVVTGGGLVGQTSRMYLSANLLIANVTGTTITFDTVGANTLGAFASPGTTLTTPIGGTYTIKGGLLFAASGAGSVRQTFLIINGAVIDGTSGPPVAGVNLYQSVSWTGGLSTGDVISIQGFQDSGGNLNVGASIATQLSLTRLA